MKINFTFDTENEQDRDDVELFLKSREMNIALFEIRQELRALYKYNETYDHDTLEHVYGLVCDKIGDLDE